MTDADLARWEAESKDRISGFVIGYEDDVIRLRLIAEVRRLRALYEPEDDGPAMTDAEAFDAITGVSEVVLGPAPETEPGTYEGIQPYRGPYVWETPKHD